ncbi:hypothetical protein EJ06DRAFT_372038 [Trichodelitschia bisporula]|uniref:Uncharacterized protein n=1 Tax=Trichodelitschia bisporula TaxID=703511 RepID=A0A6G1I1F8_9PEZI|nr:hypothetical protein EJ06DRAFT_372038 [Trichodelitschia bisporula]
MPSILLWSFLPSCAHYIIFLLFLSNITVLLPHVYIRAQPHAHKSVEPLVESSRLIISLRYASTGSPPHDSAVPSPEPLNMQLKPKEAKPTAVNPDQGAKNQSRPPRTAVD